MWTANSRWSALWVALVASIISASAASAQTYTVLYEFPGGTGGGDPEAGVILVPPGGTGGGGLVGGCGPHPCIYGTALVGECGSHPCALVYGLGARHTPTQLASVAGAANGGQVTSGVILDAAGNFDGTTPHGGKFNQGQIYQVDSTGPPRVLYSFTGLADGGHPYSGVVSDPEGNLYGVTASGGDNLCPFGCGVIYKVDMSGHETVLYRFLGGSEGFAPNAVIRDAAGNFYGTAAGGTSNAVCPLGTCGIIFRLDSSGNYTVLHTFAGGTGDGANPFSGVIRDPAGNLYGTTEYGGALGQGVVYELELPSRNLKLLHSFSGGADGNLPLAGLARDSQGNLYGTSSGGGSGTPGYGIVYKLDTSGNLTSLHDFSGVDGAYPFAGVTLDSTGNLYGTTPLGGAHGNGVVFEIQP